MTYAEAYNQLLKENKELKHDINYLQNELIFAYDMLLKHGQINGTAKGLIESKLKLMKEGGY